MFFGSGKPVPNNILTEAKQTGQSVEDGGSSDISGCAFFNFFFSRSYNRR